MVYIQRFHLIQVKGIKLDMQFQALIYDTSFFFLFRLRHEEFQPMKTARCQPVEYTHAVDFGVE